MYRCEHCGALNRVGRAGAGTPVCGRCKRDLDTSGRPQDVDGDGLAAAVRSAQVPVLVDFWAPWCAPCRALAPAVERFSRQHAGRLIVLKLNTEQHPAPASAHGIQAIPTFVIFAQGREVGRDSGRIPQQQVEQLLR